MWVRLISALRAFSHKVRKYNEVSLSCLFFIISHSFSFLSIFFSPCCLSSFFHPSHFYHTNKTPVYVFMTTQPVIMCASVVVLSCDLLWFLTRKCIWFCVCLAKTHASTLRLSSKASIPSLFIPSTSLVSLFALTLLLYWCCMYTLLKHTCMVVLCCCTAVFPSSPLSPHHFLSFIS